MRWVFNSCSAWAATRRLGVGSISCAGRWSGPAEIACKAVWRWRRTYVGGNEEGVHGRQTQDQAIVVVAAE